MASVMADVNKRVIKEPLITILDDLDLTYTKEQVEQFVMMWNSGFHIEYMARWIRPHDKRADATDEVALLAFHLKRQGLIEVREGGLLGTE